LLQHLAKRPVDGSQPSILAKGNNNATADASSDKCARDTTHLRLFLQSVVKSVFELIGALSLPRTQIRAYRWCSPPRIGCATMSRTARSGACRAHPSQAQGGSAPHNNGHTSKGYVEGGLR
jgi:hypothetical protein